jgi:hypothetical protein
VQQKKINQDIQNWTGTIAILALVCTVLLAGMGVYLLPLQPNMVALQTLVFTPAEFNAILNAWGPQGVVRFRNHLPVDGFFLLCYGALGYLLTLHTGLFSQWSVVARKAVSLMLPLAAAFDAVENLLQWHLTALQAPAEPLWYLVSGTASMLKWLLIVLFVASCALARVRHKS